MPKSEWICFCLRFKQGTFVQNTVQIVSSNISDMKSFLTIVDLVPCLKFKRGKFVSNTVQLVSCTTQVTSIKLLDCNTWPVINTYMQQLGTM